MFSNKLKIGITGLIVFAIILIPSMRIPMHSDDYFYYFLGNSPQEMYDHYLIWSGRVLANAISSTLLYNFSHTTIEIINSIAFLALCFFISFIPIVVSKERNKYHPFMLIFVFLTYWVSNPKLGETSFWIVGSANYLWTNMFIGIYIISMFSAHKTNNKIYYLLTFALGVIAGCSNENTSIIVVLLSIVLVIFEKNKISLTLGLIGSIIGTAILLLSPGTRNRATLYTEWNHTSFLDKFFTHFYERFPSSVEAYWFALLMMFVVLLFASTNKTISKRTLNYSLFFLVCALLSNAAFVGSPAFPERSMNGGLCFLLISASFIVSDICQCNNKITKSCISIVMAGLLFYFIPSYYWFVNAVNSNWEQDKIRQQVISNAKKQGAQEIYIPDFYFTTLAKQSDMLDTYQNEKMNEYFKVKNLIKYSVPFDYSHISTGEYIPASYELADGISLTAIKFYKEVNRFSISNKMLMKFSLKETPQSILGDHKKLSLNIECQTQKGNSKTDEKFELSQIGDYFYSSVDIHGCNKKNTSKISIVMLDNISKEEISRIKIK